MCCIQTQMAEQRYIVDRMDEAGGFTFVYFNELYEQWRSDDDIPDTFNRDQMKLFCIRNLEGNPDFEFVAVNMFGEEFPYPLKPLALVKDAICNYTTTLGWGAVTFVMRPCSIQEESAEWRRVKMEETNLARHAAFNEYIANESTELTALVRQALANAIEVLGEEPEPIGLLDSSDSVYNPALSFLSVPKEKQVQNRVERVMIEKAIEENLSCSITLTPLTQETAACVAPCYHVFDKEAIQIWLTTKNTCPECRRVCSL
jgi:hypothetical protein